MLISTSDIIISFHLNIIKKFLLFLILLELDISEFCHHLWRNKCATNFTWLILFNSTRKKMCNQASSDWSLLTEAFISGIHIYLLSDYLLHWEADKEKEICANLEKMFENVGFANSCMWFKWCGIIMRTGMYQLIQGFWSYSKFICVYLTLTLNSSLF